MADSKRSVEAITDFFLSSLDAITDRAVETFVKEIPAYAALDSETLASVRAITRGVFETGSRVIQQQRLVRPSDIETFVDSARRRARQGLPIDAILQAYRIGLLVWWDELRNEQAVDKRLADPGATQEVTGAMIGYINDTSTAVSEAYLDERDRLAADVERQNRLLVNALLEHGPMTESAQRASSSLEIRLAASYWVVLLATEPVARTPTEMARTLRGLLLPHPAIAMAQQDEVLVLWPEERDGLEALVRAHGALVAEYGQTIAAVAGPRTNSLNEALAETREVMSLVRHLPSGIYRLEDVLLDAIIHQVGTRTKGLLAQLTDPLLERDRSTKLGLRSMLQTFVKADASLRETGRRLNLHRNTIDYRLKQIRQLTGRDPKKIEDLFLLHASLSLHGRTDDQ